MIFADKLIALRKKAGWSQEELAQQLNVSRQSVSKWEGAQSVPDLDKIVQLSRIFGVSTDYLLKDELEEQEPAPSLPEQPQRRRVSMEEASRYLELRRAAAPRLALATFLCVVSPIALILLGGLSEYTAHITENAAAGIGLSVLIVLVAAAVGNFLTCGVKAKAFSFLETEPFETEYGVSGMVRQRQQDFQPTANRLNMIGTILCIMSVLPLFLGEVPFQLGSHVHRRGVPASGLCRAGLPRVRLCRDADCRDGKAAGRGRLHPPEKVAKAA